TRTSSSPSGAKIEITFPSTGGVTGPPPFVGEIGTRVAGVVLPDDRDAIRGERVRRPTFQNGGGSRRPARLHCLVLALAALPTETWTSVRRSLILVALIHP